MAKIHRRGARSARILAGALLAATTLLSGCFYHHGHYGRHDGYGYDRDHGGGNGHGDGHDRDRDRRRRHHRR